MKEKTLKFLERNLSSEPSKFAEEAKWRQDNEVYAIRIEPNVYIVTGGAIKLTATMQDREHTQMELDKLNACRNYLQQNGIFDKDSFVDFFEEDLL